MKRSLASSRLILEKFKLNSTDEQTLAITTSKKANQEPLFRDIVFQLIDLVGNSSLLQLIFQMHLSKQVQSTQHSMVNFSN